MGIKTTLFLLIFLVCCGGALFMPLLAVLGYVAHYVIGPETQWWAAPLKPYDIRYSLTLAVMAAVGIALHWHRLRLPGPTFSRQEWVMLLFLAIAWFSTLVGEQTVGLYTTIDPPAMKLLKTTVFALMLTNVVTSVKNLNYFFWVLILSTWVLAIQANSRPQSEFVSGRLEGVGGVDFQDANFFGAFLVCMLPIIGIQFLRSRLAGKLVCLATGVFTVNGIVLTRSRGAFLAALVAAVVALLFAPKRLRGVIVLGLLVAAIGSVRLMDPAYIERVATIGRSEEERDRSSQSRIEIWGGGMRMMLANPLGVGAGNFVQAIGRYMPTNANRDAHNTYVRCAGELGIPGIAVLLLLIVTAFGSLRKTSALANELPDDEQRGMRLCILASYSSLAAVCAASITVTLLYVENFWWFLSLPICLSRVVERLLWERESALDADDDLETVDGDSAEDATEPTEPPDAAAQ